MSVILFIVILVILIVGHEFGHLIAAKRAGMKVPEFGVGFPPRLWGKKIGDTEYTVNALPFGGFVKIVGEDGANDDPDAFSKKPKSAQALTLFAGPFANVLIGALAFYIAFLVGMPTAVEEPDPRMTGTRVVVSELLPNSPAAKAGVSIGDTVLSVTVGDTTTVVRTPADIAASLPETGAITLLTMRGGEERSYTVTPSTGVIPDNPEKKALGVGSLLVGTIAYGPLEALFKAAAATLNGLWAILVGFGTLIAGLVTWSASLETLSGPVGIATLVGDAAYFGAGQVLALTAVLSLNLAILNLLPFPALDGGRLAMLGIEVVRGRAVHRETAAVVNTVGFFILIGLMLIVTWNDIAKLIA